MSSGRAQCPRSRDPYQSRRPCPRTEDEVAHAPRRPDEEKVLNPRLSGRDRRTAPTRRPQALRAASSAASRSSSPDDFEDDDDDDDLDDEEEFDDEEDERPHGSDHRRVRQHRPQAPRGLGGRLRPVLIDRTSEPDDPDVIVADLGELDESWITHFHGVDTVIHLAANPNEFAAWEELREAEPRRALQRLPRRGPGGRRPPDLRQLEPRDGRLSRAGRHADHRGPPAHARRPLWRHQADGRTARPEPLARRSTSRSSRSGSAGSSTARTAPKPSPTTGRAASGSPTATSFACSTAPSRPSSDDDLFVVVNGMSNNRGTRWDLTAAAERLGYSPEDDAYAEELSETTRRRTPPTVATDRPSGENAAPTIMPPGRSGGPTGRPLAMR